MKTAVLVDGAFYLKRHKAYFKKPLNDAQKIAKDLLNHCLKHIDKENGERLYRIFFYDCPPVAKKMHHPLTNKAIDLGKTQTAIFRNNLHYQLKQTRNVALRLGYLDDVNGRWKIKDPETEKRILAGKQTRNDLASSDIIYHAVQKGVDMKIGLDIASLAYERIVEKIVLISGDSDFVPAAKFARRRGIELVLDPMYKSIKLDLLEHIDGLNTTLPNKKRIEAKYG